jgi:uncharacterized membrane protein
VSALLEAPQLTRRAVVPVARRTGGAPGPGLPLLVAALAFDLALVPTLLPRPWWVNGVFVGVAAAEAYVAAAVVQRCLRLVRRAAAGRRPLSSRRLSPRRRPGRGGLGWVVAACLLGVSTAVGQLRQAALERGMGLDPGTALEQVVRQSGSVALGAATAVVLVGLVLVLARGAARAWRAVRRPFAGSRSTRASVMVLVLALGACTMSSVSGTSAAALPRPASSVGDAGQQPDASSLGPKGRQFVRGTTSSSTISRVTGAPARQPVRVYAELRPGEDDRARAVRGVRQLVRAGGLERSAVVVVVPTGSGWVDPAGVSAVETLAGGDVATLAVQYADVPSWVAYLRGAGAAERSAAAALRDVRSVLDGVPARRRPRLLVYGESLGALGGLRALARGGETVDGALWVGVPADVTDLSRQARQQGQGVLVHRSDPVAAWSVALAVRPAPGWRSGWWPVVTFWQATADLVSAYSTPDGYGHRYGAELVDAWRPVLRRAGVGSPVTTSAVGSAAASLTHVRALVTATSDGGSSLPSRAPRG